MIDDQRTPKSFRARGSRTQPASRGFLAGWLFPFNYRIQDGKEFTISYSPAAIPDLDDGPTREPALDCPSGNWTRDPTYYGVHVSIEQGWLNFVLDAPVGDISPQ